MVVHIQNVTRKLNATILRMLPCQALSTYICIVNAGEAKELDVRK